MILRNGPPITADCGSAWGLSSTQGFVEREGKTPILQWFSLPFWYNYYYNIIIIIILIIIIITIIVVMHPVEKTNDIDRTCQSGHIIYFKHSESRFFFSFLLMCSLERFTRKWTVGDRGLRELKENKCFCNNGSTENVL